MITVGELEIGNGLSGNILYLLFCISKVFSTWRDLINFPYNHDWGARVHSFAPFILPSAIHHSSSEHVYAWKSISEQAYMYVCIIFIQPNT